MTIAAHRDDAHPNEPHLKPGFYLPCGAFFDADYLVLAHRMDGCEACEDEESIR